MSDYDNDSRVQIVDEYFVIIHGGDKYNVLAKATDRWFTVPALDSRAITAADLRTREETEAWVLERRTGPFPSRDAAIASLIGAPR